MHYDHISFHLADLPAGTPPQHAAHHIGYYFAWAVSQGLHSTAAASLPNFSLLRQGKISGATFVLTQLNGGIDKTCFNDLGRRFTEYYYADEDEGYGHFIHDYFHTLDLDGTAAFYQTADSPEHQHKLNRVFQTAFQRWHNSLKR
ncbi:hypothetical protein [Conchiformibius kuhniae]|uniref:DUF7832 domain-containing protein n=1 Tax=Conchiformibius kuhniae TaxID=211502 RepID=A0A8T9MV30_9NEIS|nr:hypothetical protein [Conchiformibius kuhniae]UOP04715.1 hypothetical protein LVJ77_11105 [Conchiformibius kuhniae]